jgi:hypothetical protein
MADEHDSWLKNALGVDISKAKKALESAGSAAKGAASKTLDAADSAGKAVLKAESAAWDGTKKAYGAVTDAYDKVAPNFDKSNKSLGEGVDWLEEKAKEGNKKAAEKYAKVPVVGKVLKVSAAVANATVDATGGVVKGVGDLTTMAGNAIVHPIDAAGSMAKGALDIAEHVPMAPGVNTTVKAAHGMVDLARGKKDGEYGGSLKELGENLAMGTHTDPNDPRRSPTPTSTSRRASAAARRRGATSRRKRRRARSSTSRRCSSAMKRPAGRRRRRRADLRSPRARMHRARSSVGRLDPRRRSTRANLSISTTSLGETPTWFGSRRTRSPREMTGPSSATKG